MKITSINDRVRRFFKKLLLIIMLIIISCSINKIRRFKGSSCKILNTENYSISTFINYSEKYSTLSLDVFVTIPIKLSETYDNVIVSDVEVTYSENDQEHIIYRKENSFLQNTNNTSNSEVHYIFKFWPEEIPQDKSVINIYYNLSINNETEIIEMKDIFKK